MKKEDHIERHGEDSYKSKLERNRDWQLDNPDKVKANNRESTCKGGKRYDKRKEYNTTGMQGERHKIRSKHGRDYRPYKSIIAPNSQIHHEWISETAKYRGVALVEAKPHQYGIIDVILILDGTITLLTEEEVRKGGRE